MKPWNDSRVAAGFFVGALCAMAFSAFVPTLGAQGTSSISGCVVPTNNNYLRISGKCAPGEFKVELATGDTKDPKAPPPNKLATRVKAPFEVVDEKGVVIMRVTSAADGTRGLRVFNDGAQQVAVMNVFGDGGFVTVMRNGQREKAVSISSTDTGPAIVLRDGDGEKPRVSISAEKGTLGMRVFNASGKLAAAIGHISTGAGLATIYDAAGKQRATVGGTYGTIAVRNSREMVVAGLGAVNDNGVIEIVNGEQSIARLTQGDGGTGLLQVMDAGGTPLVDASIANGLGFVRAYPMSKVTLPGIPGSSIQGRK